MKNYHLCGGMLPPYSNLVQEMLLANKKYQMVGCSHPTSELDRGIGSFQWWNVSTIQQIEDVRVVGWEYPTKFPIISTVWREFNWNRNKSKDKSFRDCHTSMCQMVGYSHPTVELDRDIGSFQWWNVSAIQQIEDVRVVGWEYPTKKLQITNNIYKRLKNA